PAAEVVDGDRAGLLAIEPVCERPGGRCVDDAEHVESGDPPGVAGRLPLAVVEVGRDGDDRLGRIAGAAANFLQDEGGKLFGRVFTAGDPHGEDFAATLGLALD